MTTTVPGVTTSVADGQLGAVSPDRTGVAALIGTSTAGTANLVKAFAGNARSLVQSTYGDGTLPDWLINHLIGSGGKETLGVKGTGSTAGSNSAVAASGSGPTVTLTGTATEDADLIIEIVAGGAVATSTFRFSFDGGNTWKPTRKTAATVALGNGVTAAFAVGTYFVAERYTATLTGPRNSVSDMGDAVDALLAYPSRFGAVHLLGHPADASALATLIAAFEAKIAAAPLMAKFPFGILEAPPVDPDLLVTALASVEAPNTVLCGGFAQVYDDADRQIEKVNCARIVASRVMRNPISVEASRNVTDSDLEALTGVRAIFPEGSALSSGYLNSYLAPALNNARVTTLMTHPGRTGYYTCNTFTLAALGSDLLELPNRRIMNRAREVLFDGAQRYLQGRIRRNKTTGYIEESQATLIDRELERQLRVALVQDGHATGAKVTTNRSDDLASDPTLRMKARVVAVVRGRTVEVEVGLARAI